MDSRGESLLQNEWIMILIALLLCVGGLFLANSYRNNASLWEEFYAAELARQINLAEPGTELVFDVTTALNVAGEARKDPQSLFYFDNEKNLVVVSLREGGGHSFSFFTSVEVVNEGVALPGNTLRLRIT